MLDLNTNRRAFLRQAGAFIAAGMTDVFPKVGNALIATDVHGQLAIPGIRHIRSRDLKVIDAAFRYGYDCNIVTINIEGSDIQTLSIQSVSESVYTGPQHSFSVWTRDLYWGMLGWVQAGDDSVVDMMKSSLRLLIIAKNKNQALGQNKTWPLNDKRFYIPQAYTYGNKELRIAVKFFPWCSESQADFLLLAHNYCKLSGDHQFIESIWDDIVYVTKTIELLDTNGNSLPDALQGSYDYQYISLNTEEPLMCAKASMAYSSVAEIARMLDKDAYASNLESLAAKVKKTMNKSVEDGGLWMEKGGYYVTRKMGHIENAFIPYENLVPMWCGMTNSEQDESIFAKLDAGFEGYYDLRYGPMYCAPAIHTAKSVMNSSSVPWLGFLDVYLRGKKKHNTNRSKIFDLLMSHAYDAGGIPFSEGAGIDGHLTGGAGRTWDNGNFFQVLVCGIYGLEKDNNGIRVAAPEKIANMSLTELKDFYWKKAVYNFKWYGEGQSIKRVTVDGHAIASAASSYNLTNETGQHQIEITLHN